MSNGGYGAIPEYNWKDIVINAVVEFFEETNIDEIQVNEWHIRKGKKPQCIDHGSAIQDATRYFIQFGGQYEFDSIRIWLPQNQDIVEPALDQLARNLYPESDEIHITQMDHSLSRLSPASSALT